MPINWTNSWRDGAPFRRRCRASIVDHCFMHSSFQMPTAGRRFWGFVTTVPLTLLTLANLFVAWRASSPVRWWWLIAGLAALTDRAFTFSYFIPTMVGLMRATDSPRSVAAATWWWNLNFVRHAIVLAAWVAALQALALFHQQRG